MFHSVKNILIKYVVSFWILSAFGDDPWTIPHTLPAIQNKLNAVETFASPVHRKCAEFLTFAENVERDEAPTDFHNTFGLLEEEKLHRLQVRLRKKKRGCIYFITQRMDSGSLYTDTFLRYIICQDSVSYAGRQYFSRANRESD